MKAALCRGDPESAAVRAWERIALEQVWQIFARLISFGKKLNLDKSGGVIILDFDGGDTVVIFKYKWEVNGWQYS